jgi:hypothetical protein
VGLAECNSAIRQFTKLRYRQVARLLFNRIQEMVLWTELSNLFSVQSDCPHREKFGYGGDIVASSEMGMMNFDMARFYAKAVQDLADAARPNGGFTETAPFVGISDEGLGEGAGPVGWGTAQPLLLTQLRQYYGDSGQAEAAFRLVNQRTFPGWGHMLESGATTLWEHWEFSDNTFSHNHPMFGSVSEWFYKTLAGIQPAPDAVGFDKILIKPQPVGDLRWVRASHDTVRGKVTSAWDRTDGKFRLRVTIPANASARVYVPAPDANHVLESGKPAATAPGVRFVGMEAKAAVFAVGSGAYEFDVVSDAPFPR